MSQSRLKPRIPGGFRDYSPEEYSRRQWALERISQVYKSFGFLLMDTSAVEYFETLAGGDETSKQIFRIFNQTPDLTGESLALRFDLTVSLARFIAANRKSFTFPFKRYQMGEVWRGERQQKGRFKQFLQFDADIVGTAHPAADAEIVILTAETMKALGIENYTIKLNNRRILNGFIRALGLKPDDVNPFLRILDKMDKVGWEGVKERLKAPKPAPVEIEAGAEGMGLGEELSDKVKDFLILPRGNWERLDAIKKMGKEWEGVIEGAEVIGEILRITTAGEVPGERIDFDPALARGLDYYTGPVFETVLDDLPDLGSVMSGGRYDNLVERFSGESIPATGISLGVDRLLVGLEEMGIAGNGGKSAKVMVTGVGLLEDPAEVVMQMARNLRSQGIIVELYLGDNRGVKKQMNYADRRNIRYCILLGPEEMARGVFQLKNMVSGEQQEFPQLKVAEIIMGLP